MKHPFDDFVPEAWQSQRADKRVIRIGILLTAVISIATATAFATTLAGWRGILNDRDSITSRWEDARERMNAYMKVQKEIQDSINETNEIKSLANCVPRSLLLWQLTQILPENTRLDDLRLETQKRTNEDEEVIFTETVMVLGIAPNDTSISSYIDQLASSPLFTNVSLMYAQLAKDGHSRNFSIQMKVREKVQVAMEELE
jgi:Tfp pilus assembly protein PilN